MYIRKYSLYLVAFVAGMFVDSVVFGGEMNMNYEVNDGIKKIVLKLDGATSVSFVESDMDFTVSDIKFKNIDHNPIKIGTEGDTLVMEQKHDGNTSFEISYTLYVPRGREIQIDAGHLDTEGRLDASSLRIKSGNMLLRGEFTVNRDVEIKSGNVSYDATFRKTGSIRMQVGNAGGKLRVPSDAEVSGVPFWSHVDISK